MAEKPQDDARDVHDEPDKSDENETVPETLSRHEELHREHRERCDRIERHLGLGEPADDARGVHDEPDRADSVRSRRRRHD